MLTEDQLSSIAGWAQRGADLGQASLREIHTGDSGLEIRNIHCATLSDLPDRVPTFDGECVAGVVNRFEGGMCGTALLAMDPEDALAWVRAKPGDHDPLASFVSLGAAVQSSVVCEIGKGLGLEMRGESADLIESSVPLILFGTHAPSDTAVVAISMLVAAGDEVLPVQIYLMIEPKLLCTALAA
jgi:hypothetical protein